jgi:hypothetical protein
VGDIVTSFTRLRHLAGVALFSSGLETALGDTIRESLTVPVSCPEAETITMRVSSSRSIDKTTELCYALAFMFATTEDELSTSAQYAKDIKSTLKPCRRKDNIPKRQSSTSDCDTVVVDGRLPPLAAIRDSGKADPSLACRIAECLPLDLEFVRRLGVGGFSEVYLLEDVKDGERFALKVFHDREHSYRIYQREFTNQLLGRAVCHKIPLIINAGIHGLHPYMLMEYVEGVPLNLHVRARKFNTTRKRLAAVARVGALIGDALYKTHEIGVIHGDVTPTNIIVRPDDHDPVLLDFGLTVKADETDYFKGIFPPNSLVGTNGFMAPERLLYGIISMSTDQFGLGASLYNVITSDTPFGISSLYRIRGGEYSINDPRMHVPECPESLAKALLRSMSYLAQSRYTTCKEFADDLRKAEQELSDSE